MIPNMDENQRSGLMTDRKHLQKAGEHLARSANRTTVETTCLHLAESVG